ncbi:hypothetical protein ACVWZR_006923 [Bradyrhizobium sp. i1.3.1]
MSIRDEVAAIAPGSAPEPHANPINPRLLVIRIPLGPVVQPDRHCGQANSPGLAVQAINPHRIKIQPNVGSRSGPEPRGRCARRLARPRYAGHRQRQRCARHRAGEIASVAASSAGSLTPTISQRRVKSSVAVTGGQTVLLAGLISETENKQRQGLPILDSIPGVGDAFSHQGTGRSRTELILFIRPTVMRDRVDAHVTAGEVRSKMNGRLVGTSNPVVVVPKATR